ncbi:class I SAM-dependent methyltransferase [Candidatus Magnetominusculus dajiuhuensis]|uniref:class I SAM-dependent methyltransferase n=1 Tax=Candidatus Magnetominusculus dajiuhuensis TaxID=3137712 RepID=UPI003B42AF5F
MGRYDEEELKWNKKAGVLLKKAGGLKIERSYEEVFTAHINLRPIVKFFNLHDKKSSLLDIGCGAGWTTCLLAQVCKTVDAFDISESSIGVLRERMRVNSIDNIRPFTGNAEEIPFDDGHFDFVFGNAVLHHVTLERVIPEIARVLKTGGKAAFCEPYTANIAINILRYIKHNIIDEYKGTDVPLRPSDILIFKKYFSTTEFIETSIFSHILEGLMPIERVLLEKIPSLKKQAGYITILLQKG